MNENIKLLKYFFRFAIVYVIFLTMLLFIRDKSAAYFDYDYEIISKIAIFTAVIELLLIVFAIIIVVSKFIQDYKRVPSDGEKIKLSILSFIFIQFADLPEKYLYTGNIGTIFEFIHYSGTSITGLVFVIFLQILLFISFILLIDFIYGLTSKIMFKKYNKSLQ
ncbi:hypothetical protein Arnit_3076 [Arcobacter nitrofigilis DSM 7299]|uniref:Uncharacterized protein n=1 Tax=Arcobacter nitrofigilis (strain ATCC 33309 / DSM 7299 / CCUG 15893 / LMG 7604 / NCTC 12251 / CI) TaxID=572480 RepID=D5V7V3_ARCNC|nr:hypothetical protein [Arcobacter nitrofigilis]ADG94723.1 hypothetical protein Arnit_3076 [Arcobacter nitrofigilis DSM 7299]